MRLDITGRHIDVTASHRQLIARRLVKLERLLNDSAISAQVILTKEKYRHRTEIVIHARGDNMLRGHGEGTIWAVSVREAATKIEQQAQKLKGKWGDRKRRGAGVRSVAPSLSPAPEQPPAPRVVRATRYAVKPMSLEDAAFRLESSADAFVVYRHAESDAVRILYRRADGNYGLIEPD